MADKKKWAQLIAKAWADEGFKKKLMENPVEVLKQEGIEVPGGVSINAVEDTKNSRTLVLPPVPDDLGKIEDLEERTAAECCPNCSFCT